MEGPGHKRLATHRVPKSIQLPSGGHSSRDNQYKLCTGILLKAVPHRGGSSISKAGEDNSTKMHPGGLEADNPAKCPGESN